MTVGRQLVVVRLTPAQTLRMERMGECLWPTERLDIGEISQRLLLEHLLYASLSGTWWSRCEPASKARLKPARVNRKSRQWIENAASLHHTVGSDNGRATNFRRQVLIGGLIALLFIRSHVAAFRVFRVGSGRFASRKTLWGIPRQFVGCIAAEPIRR